MENHTIGMSNIHYTLIAIKQFDNVVLIGKPFDRGKMIASFRKKSELQDQLVLNKDIKRTDIEFCLEQLIDRNVDHTKKKKNEFRRQKSDIIEIEYQIIFQKIHVLIYRG